MDSFVPTDLWTPCVILISHSRHTELWPDPKLTHQLSVITVSILPCHRTDHPWEDKSPHWVRDTLTRPLRLQSDRHMFGCCSSYPLSQTHVSAVPAVSWTVSYSFYRLSKSKDLQPVSVYHGKSVINTSTHLPLSLYLSVVLGNRC